MTLWLPSFLFQQFLTQRRYLKNVTPSTIEWYETAFKALQRSLGADSSSWAGRSPSRVGSLQRERRRPCFTTRTRGAGASS